MALQVWLPLNGNLENQGLSNVNVINYNATVDSSGKIGSCYSLSVGNYLGLDAPNVNNHKYSPISVALWFYPTQNDSTDRSIIGCWENGGGGFFIKNQKIGVSLYIGGSYITCNAPSTITLNLWHHICYTYDGTTIRMYIDGQEVASAAASGTITYHSTTPWQIGGNPSATAWGSGTLAGKINDVRIYDNCLSPQEVKEISQALVLHYKLDSIRNNILPPGIELYDSIQGDGNSTIYTSIPYDSTKNTYKIKCKFSQPTNVGSWDSVFAAYTDENSKTIRIIRGNSNNLMYMYYNNKAGSGNPVVFTTSNANIKEVTITSTNVVCIENGTTDTHGFGTPSGTDTQSTFDLIRNSKSVIYYWTIWDGDVMLGNFLPATFYGEPGMYDTVTKRFFHNEGTGTFILGNKITIKEYEYLQCDTASYIKSGVIPTTSTNFEMKYAVNSLSAETVYFGCSTASAFRNGNNYSLDILTSGSLIYTFRNQEYDTSPYTTTANTPFVVRLQGDTFSINGNPMPANRHTSHPNLEIYLFARNVNGTNNAIKVGKIYYCKFWEGDTLIRDFVPVSYNGTLGLFDKVELKFYPNAGSGTFTAGTLVSEIVEDCSGYGHDGTVTGDISMNSNSARYKESSFITAGLTNYIKSPIVKVDEKGITMSIWIKSSDTAPTGDYHMPFEGGNYGYGEMSIYKTGYLRGGLYVNGTRYVQNSTSTVLLDGNWHMITMTYDGSAIRRYIDAVLDNSTTVSGTLNNTSQEWYLGRYGTHNSYGSKNMYISDARLYATALSDADIADLYHTSAIVDNLGNLHTFQAKEDDSTPEIMETGDAVANNFLELGNRIKTLSDGSVWLHVLHHENPASNLFTAANCWNYDNGSTLYSALWLLQNDVWKYDGKYELLACEKLTSSSSEVQYRWTQTSNPATTSTATGFQLLSGTANKLTDGLANEGTHGCFDIAGSNWWCCCGAYSQYQSGVPGFGGTVTSGSLDLYIRITQDIFKNPESDLFSIYETGYVQNELIEI